jgi:hypothetical protein
MNQVRSDFQFEESKLYQEYLQSGRGHAPAALFSELIKKQTGRNACPT